MKGSEAATIRDEIKKINLSEAKSEKKEKSKADRES